MFEECKHCLRTVAFHEDGTCPSCGNSRYVSPTLTRKQILQKEEDEKVQLKVEHLKDLALKDMLIGGVILAIGLFISMPSLLVGRFIVVTYGLIGFGGLRFIRGVYYMIKSKLSVETKR